MLGRKGSASQPPDSLVRRGKLVLPCALGCPCSGSRAQGSEHCCSPQDTCFFSSPSFLCPETWSTRSSLIRVREPGRACPGGLKQVAGGGEHLFLCTFVARTSHLGWSVGNLLAVLGDLARETREVPASWRVGTQQFPVGTPRHAESLTLPLYISPACF